MTLKTDQPVSIACIYTWLGFIGGISFLEAWLKFRAPGVTLPIGLGIGRIVFAALNKIEWVFAAVILTSSVILKKYKWSLSGLLFSLIVIILAIQTCWLLPQLDLRAQLYINGSDVAPSKLHVYFIGAECIKAFSLMIFGASLFKK